MSLEIEFEEPDYMKKKYTTTQAKGISASLIKGGWAHDQASANRLLIFFAVLIILATCIVYYMFVYRPQHTSSVRLSENVINRLPFELQTKIRASQR